MGAGLSFAFVKTSWRAIYHAYHQHVLRHHRAHDVYGHPTTPFAAYSRRIPRHESCFVIPTGELLEGELPSKKIRQVQVWIDLHEEELMADWSLAVNGEPVFPIDPLR